MNTPGIAQARVQRIDGDMNIECARRVFESVDFSGLSGETALIDLSGVGESDSAGLAVMLEWVRLAKQRDVKLRFSNIPEQLQKLIDMADLQQILTAAE